MDARLAPGFRDPVLGSQAVFRSVLTALSRPGLVQPLAGVDDAPDALGPVGAAVLLTLVDFETPLWLSPGADDAYSRSYLAFHTGAPIVDVPHQAAFLFLAQGDAVPPLEEMRIGDSKYPDRSTTLILSVESFTRSHTLSGPGIQDSISFGAQGLCEGFWTLAMGNHALYPLGVDFIFAGPQSVAGLPRSTLIRG